jgi:hypothetical protein
MMRNKTIYILVLLLVLSVNIVVFAINSNDVGNKLNYESDVIYQILTDRFFDGDSSNNNPYNLVNSYDPYKTDVNKYFGGDWQGIIDKIQYLANMGVSASIIMHIMGTGQKIIFYQMSIGVACKNLMN